jgi:hypothetical protein
MRKWRYRSIILDLGNGWRRGQIHALAGLPLWKEPQLEIVWAPEPIMTLRTTDKFLTLTGNITLAVQPVARFYTD